jgi:hypothetical protein
VDTSFTTTELGRTPVSVLLVKSFTTERETNPLGVTTQEQQDTSCSSGENAYTLTQMLPAGVPIPGPFNWAPLAPEFEMLITESPADKLEAYLIWNGESAVMGFWAKATTAVAMAAKNNWCRRFIDD